VECELIERWLHGSVVVAQGFGGVGCFEADRMLFVDWWHVSQAIGERTMEMELGRHFWVWPVRFASLPNGGAYGMILML